MTQPTDEEIRELWSQYNPMHGIQSFARAVLAKWGAPQQAAPAEPAAIVKWQTGGLVAHLVGDVEAGDLLYKTAPTAQPAPSGDAALQQAAPAERVYLVATRHTNEAGTVELYERHDKFVPLADCEVLYTAPQQAAQDQSVIKEAVGKLHMLLMPVPAAEVTALDVCKVVHDRAMEIINLLEQAAPAEQKPLTEEQRNAIFDKLQYLGDNGWEVDWWKVIDEVEAAHGITGGQHGAE